MVRDSVLAPRAAGRERTKRPVARTRRWWLHPLSVVVLLVGLAVTAGLSAVSRVNYDHNERRQVATQAQLAAAAVAVGPVDLQRLLGRATTLVSATHNVSLFDGALKQSVPQPFVSVRLFHMVDGAPRQVHSLGQPTRLDTASPQAQDLLRRAASSGSLTLTRVATATSQRLGYAFAGTTLGQTYVAYAEQVLPGNRRITLPAESPLADMTFALYYGKAENPDALLETNAEDLPLGSDAARVTIPFGDHVLSAAMTPRTPLLGTFAARLTWLIAGAGVLLSAVMALLTERLARRRAIAEQLARVTGQLYRAQRGVAETLQTALLPHQLPTAPRLAVATRYLGGTEGIEVGGDWYDLIELPENRMFFTVGDVSGRGLSAATMMSRLRHSITAYAVEGNDPAMVLTKVSGLIDVLRDGHFATALCGIIDLDTGVITVANAGHPPLVLVTDGVAEQVVAPVSPPLGVGSHYATTDVPLRCGAVILAYTDGLIERRDESIDAGIAHLCRVASRRADLENLLDTVLTELLPQNAAEDDTAILGLRWAP
ncbi:PP2C family protein-serine/threonine phosphatase [Nocardioides sp. DS6]|uniref:PP2C family protein-serine/threonine phosphatase n=1 Tax=Nocardioides eburneus TaxID=3231482 RepID=A0ABV3SXD7_9ACTN